MNWFHISYKDNNHLLSGEELRRCGGQLSLYYLGSRIIITLLSPVVLNPYQVYDNICDRLAVGSS